MVNLQSNDGGGGGGGSGSTGTSSSSDSTTAEQLAQRELAGGLDRQASDSVSEHYDQDTGDTTTRRLRHGARSDPMHDQTEPVDIGNNGGKTQSDGQNQGQNQGKGTSEYAKKLAQRELAGGLRRSTPDSVKLANRERAGGLRPTGGESAATNREVQQAIQNGESRSRPARQSTRYAASPGSSSGATPPPPSGGSSGSMGTPVEFAPTNAGLENTGSDKSVTVRIGSGTGSYVFHGPERQAARQIERNVLQKNPNLTPEDIAVTHTANGWDVELTKAYETKVDRQVERSVGRRRAEAAGLNSDVIAQMGGGSASDLAGDLHRGKDYTITESPEGTISINLTPSFAKQEQQNAVAEVFARQTGIYPNPSKIDVGGKSPQVGAEAKANLFEQQRSEFAAKARKQFQQQIGESRAAALGYAGAGGVTDATVLAKDIREGEDFTVTSKRGENGQVSFSASLTPSFERSFRLNQAKWRFEQQLTKQQGEKVTLNPQTDIKLTDSGATLTESGKQKARGDEFAASFDLPVPWFANPNGKPTGIPGFRRLDTKSETSKALQSVDQFSTDVGGTFKSGFFGAVGLQNSEWAKESTQWLEGGVAAPVSHVLSVPSDVENIGEFGAKTAETIQNEGLGVSYKPAGTRTNKLGMQVAAPISFDEGGAVQFATTEAIETGTKQVTTIKQEASTPMGRARIGGSLLGSALIMGGAGAVSEEAGLGSRLAIQPGEEALGYGGSAATKALAGERWAGRLFPENEPLIFSEEAGIRTATKAGSKLKGGLQTARGVAAGNIELAELAPTMKGELYQRFRPGGPTGVVGESSSFAAPVSEPLGGAGRMIDYEVPSQTGNTLRSANGGRTTAGAAAEEATRAGVTPSLRNIASDVTAREQLGNAAKEFGISPSASRAEIRDALFGGTERGQVDLSRLAPETESRSVGQPDVVNPDVTDAAYRQFQDWAGKTGRSELEARRSQFADFGTELGGGEGEGTIVSQPELTAGSEFESGAGRGGPRIRTENLMAQHPATNIRVGIDSISGPVSGNSPAIDVFAGLATDLGIQNDLVVATDLMPEAATDLAYGTETSTQSDLITGVNLELETTDVETESEFRFNTEGEQEVKTNPTDLSRNTQKQIFGKTPGWVRRQRRELLNPITGK